MKKLFWSSQHTMYRVNQRSWMKFHNIRVNIFYWIAVSCFFVFSSLFTIFQLNINSNMLRQWVGTGEINHCRNSWWSLNCTGVLQIYWHIYVTISMKKRRAIFEFQDNDLVAFNLFFKHTIWSPEIKLRSHGLHSQFIGYWMFDAPVANLQLGLVHSTEQSGLIAFRKFQSCGSSLCG